MQLFICLFLTEIKNKSQSEQPATCPICQAVIRQSRNLRRHLELRHFKKPGVKKERVKKNKGICNYVALTRCCAIFYEENKHLQAMLTDNQTQAAQMAAELETPQSISSSKHTPSNRLNNRQLSKRQERYRLRFPRHRHNSSNRQQQTVNSTWSRNMKTPTEQLRSQLPRYRRWMDTSWRLEI